MIVHISGQNSASKLHRTLMGENVPKPALFSLMEHNARHNAAVSKHITVGTGGVSHTEGSLIDLTYNTPGPVRHSSQYQWGALLHKLLLRQPLVIGFNWSSTWRGQPGIHWRGRDQAAAAAAATLVELKPVLGFEHKCSCELPAQK